MWRQTWGCTHKYREILGIDKAKYIYIYINLTNWINQFKLFRNLIFVFNLLAAGGWGIK